MGDTVHDELDKKQKGNRTEKVRIMPVDREEGKIRKRALYRNGKHKILELKTT